MKVVKIYSSTRGISKACWSISVIPVATYVIGSLFVEIIHRAKYEFMILSEKLIRDICVGVNIVDILFALVSINAKIGDVSDAARAYPAAIIEQI